MLQRYLDPGTPTTHSMAAQLLAGTRDFKRAAIYQRAFVASQPEDAGRAWGFLGDILQARGDKLGARVAGGNLVLVRACAAAAAAGAPTLAAAAASVQVEGCRSTPVFIWRGLRHAGELHSCRSS